MERKELRKRVLNLAKWTCYGIGGFFWIVPPLLGLTGLVFGLPTGDVNAHVTINGLQIGENLKGFTQIGLAGLGLLFGSLIQGSIYVVVGMAFGTIAEIAQEMELIA